MAARDEAAVAEREAAVAERKSATTIAEHTTATARHNGTRWHSDTHPDCRQPATPTQTPPIFVSIVTLYSLSSLSHKGN